jgi:pimeloyl-ACP methyl ester carboxylesterase
MSESRTHADFWFDPLCPWAWITSRWILEVEQVRPVSARWHLMSLAYLNLVQHRGEGLSPEHLQRLEQAWGPVRICAAAAEERGDDVLLPLYTALGTRFHNQQRRDADALAEAVAEVGLPLSLLDAASSTDLDEVIKASHQKGMDLVGLDVGTPIIDVQGNAFFGPVVTPTPRGETAGRLWDDVLMVTGTDGFFEIKRTRDRTPGFDLSSMAERAAKGWSRPRKSFPTIGRLGNVAQDDIELHTTDGVVLHARWRRAEAASSTVVIAHGFSASQDDEAVSALADDLWRGGHNVLTYDARGHGASGGRSGVGSTEHLDVASAALAVGTQLPVVLVGVSMGAVAVVSHLATAGLDVGPVVGAVLVSGPARWRMRPSAVGVASALLTRTPPGRWAAERYLRVRIAHDWRVGEEPVSAVRRVDVPVAVIHGVGDRLLGVAHGRVLHEAVGGPCRLDLVEGMAHGVDEASRPATLDAVGWILEQWAVRPPTTKPGR